MHYTHVDIAGMGYELAPQVVTSEELEQLLLPAYETLHFKPGQLEALTGIAERRFWDRNVILSRPALKAAQKALAIAQIQADALGMLIYAGVCRENLEPATACAVADGLGLGADTQIYDVSNACLGVLNGMVQIANAIELGQIQAGIVVSAESARQIVDMSIARLLQTPTMEIFKETIATMTGGSGAAAIVLTRRGQAGSHMGHRLLGGAIRSAVQHHRLCIWGPDTGIPASAPHIMRTDSVGVLKYGVALGIDTFRRFQQTMQWEGQPDKIICHQVGSTHQRTILDSLGIDAVRDFTTYRFLGNMGTVSLPLTAAIAHERQFLQPGDRVGFLGIGSGLNCIMLGIQW